MNRGVCMQYILLFVIMGVRHSIHAQKSSPHNVCPIYNTIMNTADPFRLYQSRGIKSMNTIRHAPQKRSLSYSVFKISFPNEKPLSSACPGGRGKYARSLHRRLFSVWPACSARKPGLCFEVVLLVLIAKPRYDVEGFHKMILFLER